MAEAGGEVQVRLSQEGGPEVVAAIQQILTKLEELTASSKATSGSTDAIAESMKGSEASGAATAFATAHTAVMQFGTMAYEAGEKIFHLTAALIAERAEDEQFEIRLTSLNEKMLGWSGATDQAARSMQQLHQMSANADMGSLVTVFQRLTLMVGGTDSQIMELTHRMELFGEKAGVTAEQLLRVIQMAERTGTLPMRGQMAVASMAMQDVGITGADIKAAAMSGTLQTLLEKLHLSVEATAALENSWVNLESTFGRAKEEMRSMLGEAFEPMKKVLSDLTAAIWSPAFREALNGWIASLKQISQEIVDVLFPALKNLGGALMNAFGDPNTITVVKALVDMLAILVNVIAGLVDALGGLAVPLAAGVIAFKSLTAAIGVESILAANVAFEEMTVIIAGVEMSAAPLLLALGGIAVALGAVGAAAVYYGLLVPEQEKLKVSNEGLTESTEALGRALIQRNGLFADSSQQVIAALGALDAAKQKLAALPQGGYEEGTGIPGAPPAELKAATSEVDRLTMAYNKLFETFAHPTAAVDPKHKGIGPDMKPQIDAAVEALQALYNKMDEKHELAGLTGVAKKIQEIQNAADAADEAMTKAYNAAIDKGWKPGTAESQQFNTEQNQLQIDANFEKEKTLRDEFDKSQKHYEDEQAKSLKQRETAEDQYDQTITALNKKTSDDILEQMRASTDAQIEGMAIRLRKQIEVIDAAIKAAPLAGYEDDSGPFKDAIEKKKTLQTDFVRWSDAQRAMELEKEQAINDLKNGSWTAYYNDLMKKAANAHQNMFVAAQENQRRLADEMEKAAQTGAQGWDAGLAKIATSVKSFGQDVSTLMTSVWSSMTSAFDTGFYDILSGKFSDLSNVLKNLWDSLLKDFSKMLEQMLVRWLMTGEAMGSGQGGGAAAGAFGGLSNMFGGGGTGNAAAGWQEGGTGFVGPTQYGSGTYYQGGGYESGSGNQGGGMGVLGYAAAAYMLYNAASLSFQKPTTSEPTYQGQSLGQTADFGGASGPLGSWLSAAAMVAVAGGFNPVSIVAAVVIAIVGVIVSLINGPQEGHVKIAIADAFSASGASTAIGGFINQIFDSTTNYVGELALKAGANVTDYTASYQKYLKAALGNATFDLAAGSPADLQKDVQAFFDTVLPKLAMQAAFGQVGYGPNGNRDATGGVAGMNWNMNDASVMDAQGNWVKHQLFDPNAPIPMMLTGLGFTADSISAIATKLSASTDMKVFKQWLADLVGVVVDLGDLAAKFGQSRDEWFAFIHKTQAEVGTAAEFADATAHFKAGGELLATIFGDDRVAAAKALVTEGQTLLNNEGQALSNILSFIDQIATQTAATIQKYQSGQMPPAENEAALRADATAGYAAIGAAMNPKDVAAAWNRVLGDMTALLDIIAARIANIKALQQSYADFRTQMATDAGPQFATDPTAWLTENQSKIDAVTATLATATGDDAIAHAKTLLGLVQDRYNNEIQMLERAKAAIEQVDN